MYRILCIYIYIYIYICMHTFTRLYFRHHNAVWSFLFYVYVYVCKCIYMIIAYVSHIVYICIHPFIFFSSIDSHTQLFEACLKLTLVRYQTWSNKRQSQMPSYMLITFDILVKTSVMLPETTLGSQLVRRGCLLYMRSHGKGRYIPNCT